MNELELGQGWLTDALIYEAAKKDPWTWGDWLASGWFVMVQRWDDAYDKHWNK